MSTLRKLMTQKGYCRIPMQLTKTNHLEVFAVLNGVEGRFILDTGASSSCIAIENTEKFELSVEDSDVKAAGAGATDMKTQLSKGNRVQLGDWSRKAQTLVLFDLVHVNQALIAHHAIPVDGILGADILKRGKAVIDYERLCVYLK